MHAVVKRSDNQVSCYLDKEVAILNLESTLYFGLDEVGAFIWQRINEPNSVIAICEAVVDQFQVDDKQSKSDVIAFLEELEKAGLIQLGPPRRKI
jgi:hypothetical protein